MYVGTEVNKDDLHRNPPKSCFSMVSHHLILFFENDGDLSRWETKSHVVSLIQSDSLCARLKTQ